MVAQEDCIPDRGTYVPYIPFLSQRAPLHSHTHLFVELCIFGTLLTKPLARAE